MTGRAALAVIEGFYGPPWSHQARREVLRFAARCGFEAYVWAPKADPLHRARWSDEPTAVHLDHTGELADAARALGMRWIYGLSPTVRLGTTTDAARVVRRLRPLQAVGVRSFVLAFDDTWPTLLPRLASGASGRAHGALARDVVAALRERDPDAEMSIVPAIYAGRVEELPDGAMSYLRGLAEHAAHVPAAWTGPKIFSPWIRGDDLRALEAATGLRLWLWSNAIANDWLPLMTGEPVGRAGIERLPGAWADGLAADVATEARLVGLNGAREPSLTRAHLWALGAWARDPARYDARAALDRGLSEALGEDAAAVLRPLLEAFGRHALAAPARLDLAALDASVAQLAAARSGGRDAGPARDEVAAHLVVLAAIPDRIASSLAEHPVALEVGGAARKVATLARAGLAALETMEAGDRGDRRAARAARDRCEAGLAAAGHIRWDVDSTPFHRLAALARTSGARRPRRLLP